MSSTPITYPRVKVAMAAVGFPVSSGAGWTPADEGNYQPFAAYASFKAGIPNDRENNNYAFVYPSVAPHISAVLDSKAPVPVANFTDTVNATGLATFTNTTTGSPTANAWAWNFGDSATATTQSPTHQYALDGTYQVSLTSSNVNGPSSPVVKSVVVNTPYTATLASSASTGAHPLAVTLTLTETVGAGSSFKWTFGDGTTATTTVANVAHTYAAAGSFTPSVIVTARGVARPSIAVSAPIVVS